MGIFQTNKGAERGVGLTLDVPRSFQWEDGVIPVVVTLTAEADRARRVTALTFTVIDDEDRRERTATDPGNVSYAWRVEGPFDVEAAGTLRLQLDIPVPRPAGREPDDRPPYELKTAGYMEHTLLSVVVGVAPQNIERYRVTVQTEENSGSALERASSLIGQGSGTSFGIGVPSGNR